MDINALFKSNYLKASDFPQARVMVIARLVIEPVGQDKEEKPVLYFRGEDRGLVLNRTNAAMIAHAHGTDTDRWAGKVVELRSEPVSFQGKIVDSIRVRGVTPAAVDDFNDDIVF